MSAVIITSVLVTLCSSVIRSELLLWGHNRLENVAPSPFAIFNDNYLNLMIDFIKPESVLAFIDNDPSTRISNQKLPQLKQLVEDTSSVYVPENEPLSFSNFSIVILDGTDTEKDTQIATSYRRMEKSMSEGNVLYILFKASHHVQRRAVYNPEPPPKCPVIYYVQGKGGFYTKDCPVLTFHDNGTNTEVTLLNPIVVTGDVRNNCTRLNVQYTLEDSKKATIRFNFTSAAGYWYLKTLQLEYDTNAPMILTATQQIMAAKSFSYHCTGVTVFKNGLTNITFKNIQVQPTSIGNKTFSDAYDCVNFTTIPIWSGILVTAIIGIVLGIALMAIADIRTMDRFDDPKGKPLNIFVNE